MIERHWGDWRITEKSMDFTKLEANALEFKVALKAGETKKVIYTVHTRW